MDKQFYILIGRSGSGKGTQALLLKEYLEKRGHTEVVHVTTGGSFRSFVEGSSHASEIAREINDTARLQPEFLAIWNWSNIFINTLKGGETVILDGAPRKPLEVSVLDGAISFFGYKPPTVIYIDVSETWACEKLSSRGRADDVGKEDQERKMSWFAEYVLPCIAMYKEDTRHTFIHINGEQSIGDVHKELIEKLEKGEK